MELKSDSIPNMPKHQQQQEEEEMQQQKKQREEKEQHFHVLAVDDSVIDRKLLEKLLKISSCQVTCVESVDKALEYLGLLNNLDCGSGSIPSSASSCCSQPSQQEGLKVNLIMTDFCMPGMSGYDLLKRVKGSSWKDVPVVVMSSENVPSRISMCLEGGAEEFMLKPLRLSDLDKIQAHILKSLDHSCTNIHQDFIHDHRDDNKIKNGEDDDNDHYNNDDNYSDDNIDNQNDNNNNNNNSLSKRKAISSEETERRPKMKGVAVPVVV